MARGEPILALRTVITTTPAELEAAVGRGNYDLIYLDTQHAAYAEQQLVDFCQAAEALGYPVEIRIPHTRDAYLVGRFCDLGVGGVLVPETTRESEVQEAVEAFYYPPVGRRSFGGASRYGLLARKYAPRDYADRWNETAVLGIQLEAVEAIVKARQLARPGVAYVSFGPTDLQFSLDAHPQFPLRTVDDCIRHVAAQLAGTGIALGIAIGLGAEARGKYEAMGLTVFQEFARS